MKSIYRLLVMLLLIFLAYYLFNFNKVEPKKKLNPVSLQNHDNSHSNSSINEKLLQQESDITAIQKTQQIPQIDQLTISEKTPDETKLDYISAYRDWQYFDNCYTDVEDFHNEKDPLQTLVERFANNPREYQTEPTPKQNTYYLHHVEICKGLIDDKSNSFSVLKGKLEKKFRRIIPKTDKEKQLQHALQMRNQLRDYQLEFNRAHRARTSLPPEQLNFINDQIQQLTVDMLQIYNANHVLTPQQAELVKQYGEKIETLRLQIVNSNQIDTELISAIENRVDGFLNSIDDYLHRVHSPDAFLVLVSVLYNVGFYQNDSTVLNRIKQQTGIYDSYYLRILNEVVMPLVACSMDYPCDAESDFILSYCLGLKDSMFSQACGLSLEDFYFSFYIGANQMNDVNNYFNFLVNRYAKK